MQNLQSNVEIIKNLLSCKIDFVVLQHKKQYNMGHLILICKLYKKQYFKEYVLYIQPIKYFFSFDILKFEFCNVILNKHHIFCASKEALIYTNQTWCRVVYFRLYKNIQTIKDQYILKKYKQVPTLLKDLFKRELKGAFRKRKYFENETAA
ncbi:TPA: hypothetical protein RZJ77_001670 [Campylobacter coli]|nr:hypothetical protein [Campylobacter coli]